MACPLRIAVVAGSALIAFLALYLTFWQSEPDDLEKDALEAESEDEVENETRKEKVKVRCFFKKIAAAFGSVATRIFFFNSFFSRACMFVFSIVCAPSTLQVKPLLQRIKTLSPREILMEGALFHRRFSPISLLWIGAVHVIVLSAVYYVFSDDRYVCFVLWAYSIRCTLGVCRWRWYRYASQQHSYTAVRCFVFVSFV